MRKNLDKDAVALLALVAAVAWGTWLFARQRLQLDAEWTDGVQRYSQTGSSGIRHAIWADAEALRGGLNSEAAERRPAVSPDGKLVVFSSGERGLNAELWVANLAGEETLDPRPLVRLNTPFDELAPAFGQDALYFASDRGGAAFGLDIWRVPYADGVFGEPESPGAGINTEADETDPAPRTDGLVFASDRARGARRDFDLYFASRAAGEAGADPLSGSAERFEVAPLDALNTPFDERDPAFASGGDALYFASDRSGGEGGFDLLRSFNEGFGWLPPEPLAGLNTAGDERGPLPAGDGFSLYFDAASDGTPDLWRARSRELFRVPPPPVGMRELFVLAVLVLLALIAWLAKRWRGVAVLYRCILASLILHAILLWFLRDVTPDAPPVVASSGEQLFHVRLAQAAGGAEANLEARDGQLETGRTSSKSAAAPARREAASAAMETSAAPTQEAMAAAAAAQVEPAREELPGGPGPSLAADVGGVRSVSEQLATHDGARGELVVATRALAVAHEGAAKGEAARQATASAGRRVSLEPRGGAVAAERAAGDTPVAEGATRSELRAPVEVAAATGGAVRAPGASEQLVQHAGASPGMALPDVVALAKRDSGERGERRAARQDAASATLDLGAAGPTSVDVGGLLAVERTARTERSSGAPAGPSRLGREAALGVEVELPGGANLPGGEGAAAGAPALQLGSAAAMASRSRDGRPSSGPRRAGRSGEVDPSTTTGMAMLPRGEAVAAAEREVPAAAAPVRGREAGPRAEPDLNVEVARADGDGLPGATRSKGPSAQAFDATSGLAALAMSSRASDSSRTDRGPRRVGSRQRDAAPARPSALGMEAAEAPAVEQVAALPHGLEETAYKNRFGQEKLRALEEFGGSTETEAAVAMGLAYLASVQRPDGSFGDEDDFDRRKYGDVRIGKTGLALLAFLGAGHFPGSGTEHAKTARRAVDFLVNTQHADNGHLGGGSAYGHGIATYALAECYALSGDAKLVAPLERAVAHILGEQQHSNDKRTNGGWGYYFADGHVWDRDRWPRVSVSVWQLMALESARLGGLDVPDAVFRDVGVFLANTWDSRRGAFRYSNDPQRLSSGYAILPASTPAALFGLSLLGVDVSGDSLAAARGFVSDRAPRTYRRASERNFVLEAKGNLYFWYYGTLAMFRAGGRDWDRWNVAMKDTLISGQAEDGSWQPISAYADYAGDDRRDKSYTTAINVLTLEVYYRYFTPLLKVR